MSEDPEGINRAGVEGWLREAGVDWADPLSFARISGGRSNLTYEVKDARRASAGPCAGRRSASASAPRTTWGASSA